MMEDVLTYVARQLRTSREKASELTGLANDAIAEVLDAEHIRDDSPEREAQLEEEQTEVNVAAIAHNLHVPESEFRCWTEDELIFIQYGQNLAEGVVAEGPTCLSATANFYCRWYNDVILKHQEVLLNDDRYQRYNEEGEVGAS